jgi:hypothetical protein
MITSCIKPILKQGETGVVSRTIQAGINNTVATTLLEIAEFTNETVGDTVNRHVDLYL